MPKPSVAVQRYKYHPQTQQLGESVAASVTELQQLSNHCKFGTTLEDMIRDCLVCSVATQITIGSGSRESGKTEPWT